MNFGRDPRTVDANYWINCLKNIGPSNPLRPHMNPGREEKVIRMLMLDDELLHDTHDQTLELLVAHSYRSYQFETSPTDRS